jgi:hypothetical protein
LWASDPFIGTWELNVSRSKFPSALLDEFGTAKPKQETIVIRELNDNELEVIVTGSYIDGALNSQRYTVPKQRGIEKSQVGGLPEGSYWVQLKINDKEIYRTLLENGKQSTTLQHIVITQDGNAINITITGIDDQGKLFEGLYFFERK